MTTWQTIWAILGEALLLAAISFNVDYDHKIWLAQRNTTHSYRPHKKGWRLKAVTSIPAVIALFIASNFICWVAALSTVFFAVSWFLFLFDGWSGLKKKKGWLYTGTLDGREDPVVDKFFRSMPWWAHLGIKLILIISSTWFYWVGLKK